MAVVDRLGRLAQLDVAEVADGWAHLGPLTGLRAAIGHLHAGPELGPWLLLVPCELLGLRTNWLRVLLQARQPGDLAVLGHQERWQPLPALYHVNLLAEVDLAMASGDRSLQRRLDRASARQVPVPADGSELTREATPGDIQAWLAKA